MQPDLCIICDSSKLDDQVCNNDPDLMIEIMSPNNTKHDIKTKFDLYQEPSVKEYWLIDPTEKILFVYTLVDGTFIGLPPQTEGQNSSSPLFPELLVALDAVFYKKQ